MPKSATVAPSVADYLTLGQATHLAPGRPSTNCMWRWCRRGVLSRNGERVRLQHVRAGGKIFTTPDWVREFTRHLAAADTAYFDAKAEASKRQPTRHPKHGPPSRRRTVIPPPPERDRARDVDLERELDAEGL
jgi:hypothetical protein